MSISKDIQSILKEYRDNETTITKLTKRNKVIQAAISGFKKVIKPSRSPKIDTTGGLVKAVKAKPTVVRRGIGNDIISIMKDGFQRDLRAIGIKLYDREPTSEERMAISNSAGVLAKNNRLIRVKQGVYRMKFVKKTTTKVGHDTRVTQVQEAKQ